MDATIRALLTEALPYIEERADYPEAMYGSFPGGDPRKVQQDPAGKWIVLGEGATVHVLTCKYGLGVYTFDNSEAADLVKRIKTVLDGAEVPE